MSEASESTEWYTPKSIIEVARLSMGGIDLDPASCDKAQLTVKAGVYFTDHGREKAWWGRIWLNPPYGRNTYGGWVDTAVKYVQAGLVQACCLHLKVATETRWFRPLWNYPMAFHKNRIAYEGPYAQSGARWPSLTVLMGQVNLDPWEDIANVVVPRRGHAISI